MACDEEETRSWLGDPGEPHPPARARHAKSSSGASPASPNTGMCLNGTSGTNGTCKFLVGLGNDDQFDAFSLGEPFDVYYRYLNRYGTASWRDWNPNGTFVDITAQRAR